MIETNFLSVVALTKAIVGGMMERNRGHIVNMSSIAGKEAYHGGGLYCGSKFALVSGWEGRSELQLVFWGLLRRGCRTVTNAHSPSAQSPPVVVDQQPAAPPRIACVCTQAG
jgi:hypothetical protein